MFYFHFLNIYQSWSIIISFKNIKKNTCQINEPKRKTSNSFFEKTNKKQHYLNTYWLIHMDDEQHQQPTTRRTNNHYFSMVDDCILLLFSPRFSGNVSIRRGSQIPAMVMMVFGNGDVTYFIRVLSAKWHNIIDENSKYHSYMTICCFVPLFSYICNEFWDRFFLSACECVDKKNEEESFEG